MHALFTRTSMGPHRSAPKATNLFISSRFVTSSVRLLGRAACPTGIGDNVIESFGTTRPQSTLAPRSASTRAVASPMPLLAPVLRTTLFWMLGFVVDVASIAEVLRSAAV